MQVTSTEFQQNVGRYQDAAQQAPVIITKRDRPHTVLMSAALFKVLVKGRVARKVEGLDTDTLKAIAEASVPAPPMPGLIGSSKTARREPNRPEIVGTASDQ